MNLYRMMKRLVFPTLRIRRMSAVLIALLAVGFGLARYAPLAAGFGADGEISSAGQQTVLAEDPFGVELERGVFLVAARKLGDPRFRETVVLLINYGPDGAVGLIINRPTEVLLSTVLPRIAGIEKRTDVVYYGGPVQGDRMLMLIRARTKPGDSGRVLEDVYVSESRATLERLIKKPKKQERFRIYAGLAGWAPGQLDFEMARGDWHISSADAQTIFEKKHDAIWPELIRRSSAITVWTTRPGSLLVLRPG